MDVRSSYVDTVGIRARRIVSVHGDDELYRDGLSSRSLMEKTLNSKKYKNVCESTVKRLMKKYDDIKDVKRKLHQIYGAYERKINYKRALTQPVEEVLKLHQSTKERVSFYDEFYSKIFAITGKPKTVLDLACGLNPLSFPDDITIYAYDIDKAEIEFLNEWFAKNNVKGKAYLQDIICKVPTRKADVAFLLKTAPCLEQQEKGISAKIISKLNAKWIIVSFPTRSIGGRGRLNYEEQYKELLKGAKKIEFKNEVIFILKNE